MEARITCCIAVAFSFLAISSTAIAADYTTRNFQVRAASPQLAKQVGDLAEKYRKELAIKWTGKELPSWPERCPIKVDVAQHAGGETSFVFMPGPNGRSAPSQWQMKIFGSVERILDSVLPHEITHTIFATHFGRPLPRWADEGACTTVEHSSERERNQRMLIEFLQTKRGIPFNHMFAMKQYPSDILPLYAQGHSLARYLIQQKGERHFVKYIGEGMNREVSGRIPQSWDQTTNKFYGYKDLSDLQVKWLKWVSDGCPEIDNSKSNEAIANNQQNIDRMDAQPIAFAQNSPSGNSQSVITPSNSSGTTQSQQIDEPNIYVNTTNNDRNTRSQIQSPNERLIDRPDFDHRQNSQHVDNRIAANENWYVAQMRSGRQGQNKTYREQSLMQAEGFRPGSTENAISISEIVSSGQENTWKQPSDQNRNLNIHSKQPVAYYGTVERSTFRR